MPKTITFQNIKIRDLAIAKNDKGEVSIAAVYSLLDDKGVEVVVKRTDLKDVSLTVKQMSDVQALFDLVESTIKKFEEI